MGHILVSGFQISKHHQNQSFEHNFYTNKAIQTKLHHIDKYIETLLQLLWKLRKEDPEF